MNSIFDNTVKIHTDELYDSFTGIETNEKYRGKKLLFSFLADFIDSSYLYSKVFIAVVRNTGNTIEYKFFLILERFNDIPRWIEFDSLQQAVKFFEINIIPLGNELVRIENWQFRNPTPWFSHLYPPDPEWFEEEFFSLKKRTPKRCLNCPFFRLIN